MVSRWGLFYAKGPLIPSLCHLASGAQRSGITPFVAIQAPSALTHRAVFATTRATQETPILVPTECAHFLLLVFIVFHINDTASAHSPLKDLA